VAWFLFGHLTVSREKRAQKEIKGIQIGKEQIKLSLFTNAIMLCFKDPKDATNKNLLDLIKSFGKVAEYKINIQKSVDFLYNNNEQTEKEIRKTILSTTDSKYK
jgi:plasmid maintenance system antidote protein VapI